jgi:hypothetical protein
MMAYLRAMLDDDFCVTCAESVSKGRKMFPWRLEFEA